MPQYKNVQYGLKQYGLFQTDSPSNESKIKWQFIRSRFGAVRKGHTFWLYTHQPATVTGKPTKLRIKTNNGTRIQEETTSIKGKAQKVRLSSNVATQPLVSGSLIE